MHGIREYQAPAELLGQWNPIEHKWDLVAADRRGGFIDQFRSCGWCADSTEVKEILDAHSRFGLAIDLVSKMFFACPIRQKHVNFVFKNPLAMTLECPTGAE
tara:strand:+ start:2538 stop:2843 length:306 start_codon:yes stop_codon:yes gene_type:complete